LDCLRGSEGIICAKDRVHETLGLRMISEGIICAKDRVHETLGLRMIRSSNV